MLLVEENSPGGHRIALRGPARVVQQLQGFREPPLGPPERGFQVEKAPLREQIERAGPPEIPGPDECLVGSGEVVGDPAGVRHVGPGIALEAPAPVLSSLFHPLGNEEGQIRVRLLDADPMDAATEIRAIIDCVLRDRIEPALQELRKLAARKK